MAGSLAVTPNSSVDEHLPQRQRQGKADHQARHRQGRAVPEHAAEHGARSGAERHANPELVRALAGDVRHHPVHADRGEQQRQHRERRDHHGVKARPGEQVADILLHRLHVRHGLRRDPRPGLPP